MASGDTPQNGSEGTAETVRGGKPGKRSPNYPYIDLQAAIGRAKVLYDRYDEHYIPVDEIADLWGMSKTSSSVVKILGALSQFGLIDDRGKGKDREIKLTERALDIFTYPEESFERIGAIKDAALAPKIYKEIWDRFQKDGALPTTDDAIRIYLIRQREDGQFNRATVDGLIQQLRRTLTFARIDGTAKIGDGGASEKGRPEDDGDQKPRVGDRVQWTSGGADQFPEPRVLRQITPDGEWGFVEGADTGVLMSELTVVEKGAGGQPPAGKTPPPNPFKDALAGGSGSGQKVKFSGPLPGGVTWELSLSKEATPRRFKQISRMLDVYAQTLEEGDDDPDAE